MTPLEGLHDSYFSPSLVSTGDSASAIFGKKRRSVDCWNAQEEEEKEEEEEEEEEDRYGLRKKKPESYCKLQLSWLPKNVSSSSDLTKDMADRSKKRNSPEQNLLQYCNMALNYTSSMRTTGNPAIVLQHNDSDRAQLPLIPAQQTKNYCFKGLTTSENCTVEQQSHSIAMERPLGAANAWLQLGLSSSCPVSHDYAADGGSPDSHHPSSIYGDMEIRRDAVEEQRERSSTLQLLPQETEQGKASRILKRLMLANINPHAAATSHIYPNNWGGIESRSGADSHLQEAIQAAYINDHHTSRPTQQAWYDAGNQSQAPFSHNSYTRGSLSVAPPVHVVSSPMHGNAMDISSSIVFEQCYDDHQQQVAFHNPTPSYPPFAYTNTQMLCSSTPRLLLQPPQCGQSDPEHSASSISCQSLKLIKASSQRKTGIWFMLEAASNLDEKDNTQTLPQIQKNYLHVKDGKVRVSVVKKYVAVKLGLQSESEMEMRCMGQDVTTPDMTLQEVRDNVWFYRKPQAGLRLREEEDDEDGRSSSSMSSTRDHIMLLTYNRRKCYNSTPASEDLSTHTPTQNYIT